MYYTLYTKTHNNIPLFKISPRKYFCPGKKPIKMHNKKVTFFPGRIADTRQDFQSWKETNKKKDYF
jgi:hypothetical protein